MNDYELAAKLTAQNVDNVVNSWADDSADLKRFNTLVRLGDSKELAMASTLNAKLRSEDVAAYISAYH